MPDLKQLPSPELLAAAQELPDGQLAGHLVSLVVYHERRMQNNYNLGATSIAPQTYAETILDGGGEAADPVLQAAAIAYGARILQGYGIQVEVPGA